MQNSKIRTLQWGLWLVLSIAAGATLYAAIDKKIDQSFFMPGPLSDGHHQLADNCQACHTSAFGGGAVLEDACMECHGEDRKKPHDSHPKAKFKDPRNAELIEKINALSCVTCHSEHRLEITHKDGVTQPMDFCVHCHQKIGEDRPSHANLEFDSCKNSGCHNYHNNRAIYTDFLVKNLDKPAMLERQSVKAREFADILEELAEYPHDKFPVTELSAAEADYPEKNTPKDDVLNEWATTAHAKSGVNCTACHTNILEDENQVAWIEFPEEKVCDNCHSLEGERFKKGKHGMRLASDLNPMKVGDARLPMHEDAGHKTMQCSSCHDDHKFDTQFAAVDACLSCHDDQHSNAYLESPHGKLWLAVNQEDKDLNQDSKQDLNKGVSCATCHMPRINFDVNDWVSRIMVDHNQSANLSPNSKMARQVCLNCHELDFSLKAMSDQGQITSNFSDTPSAEEHPSMVLARRDQERYLREMKGK